jgi:hypothetical protein
MQNMPGMPRHARHAAGRAHESSGANAIARDAHVELIGQIWLNP